MRAGIACLLGLQRLGLVHRRANHNQLLPNGEHTVLSSREPDWAAAHEAALAGAAGHGPRPPHQPRHPHHRREREWGV